MGRDISTRATGSLVADRSALQRHTRCSTSRSGARCSCPRRPRCTRDDVGGELPGRRHGRQYHQGERRLTNIRSSTAEVLERSIPPRGAQPGAVPRVLPRTTKSRGDPQAGADPQGGPRPDRAGPNRRQGARRPNRGDPRRRCSTRGRSRTSRAVVLCCAVLAGLVALTGCDPAEPRPGHQDPRTGPPRRDGDPARQPDRRHGTRRAWPTPPTPRWRPGCSSAPLTTYAVGSLRRRHRPAVRAGPLVATVRRSGDHPGRG